MTHKIILHIQNDDPIVGEVDDLPDGDTQWITLKNPERRDGKPVPYIEANVVTIIFPIQRITFIEILSAETAEGVVTHFKD